MKQLFTLALAMLFSAGLFAQGLVPGNVPAEGSSVDYKLMKQEWQKRNANKAIESRWYSYAYTMDDILGGASAFNFNNLFPDTTILVNYGSSGYSGPWIHSLGQMFDPVSDWFNDPNFYPTGLKVNQNMPYSLDSVAMEFIYLRHDPSPNIVDTLRFQIAVDPESMGANFPAYYFAGGNMPTNFGVDTVRFKSIQFHQNNLSLKASGVYTYDVLLDQAFYNDTTMAGNHIAQFATPEFANIPANYKVGVFVTFHPGYSWIANSDTLWNRNSMRFFSYEEQGDGTFPIYTPGEWNYSGIGADDSHFNTASSWYEFVICSWAYTVGYSYENHLFHYHVTADMSGVEEVTNDILTLKQNYPNPAINSTTIEYNVSAAANVNLGIYDITGALVKSLNQGLVMPGTHTIGVDLSEISSGLYYFTLEAGNSKVSRKMVVQK